MDPYQTFKFRLLHQGQPVAAFSKVSALHRAAAPVPFRAGGDPAAPRVSPGQASFEPITLERGLTTDPGFEQWMSQVWNYPTGAATPTDLGDSRLTTPSSPARPRIASDTPPAHGGRRPALPRRRGVSMATRRSAFALTAPSAPVFAIALLLAIAALVAHYGGVAIPWVSGHVIETLAAGFVLLTAGVVLRGI